MRQLLLLRHAKSSWDDPGQSDHARPLNARGKQAAAAMREEMRKLGLVPDVVLVSSARRTLQTLEALRPWDETPLIEPMDELYLASAPRLLEIIGGVAETVRSLMVVAHNPGLEDLARQLAPLEGGPSHLLIAGRIAAGFPAGALAEFTVSDGWRDFAEHRQARVVRFICPKDLPEAES